MKRTRLLLAGLATTASLITACGYDATPLPKEPEASSAAPAAPASCETTPADLRSYDPSGDKAAAKRQLANDDRLVVGVSADTLLMGARNPETNQIEGFDIDIARRIAKELDVTLQFRVISAADRIRLLQDGEIDLVVRNFTINCSRWNDIAFSAEYFHSGQKVLVRSDLAEDYAGPATLAGKRVCAPAGTTSIDNIRAEEPQAEAVTAGNHTGCLVKFQQGDVDAITGDDTVLAGLAAQDPYAAVPPQQPFTDEPYGIGANKEDTALVAFVNSVLETMRGDGSWQASYAKWLKPYLLVDATPPTPVYGR